MSEPLTGINWTQALRDAGIPEPPWDEQQSNTATPLPKALELDDNDNWMHR